jgi:hypothetical protein
MPSALLTLAAAALVTTGDATGPATLRLTSSGETTQIIFDHDSSAADPNLLSIGDSSTCTRIDGLSG